MNDPAPAMGDQGQRRPADFTADIRFDEEGFVLEYPGIAMRVPGPRS